MDAIRFGAIKRIYLADPRKKGLLKEEIRKFSEETGESFGVRVFTRHEFDVGPKRERWHDAVASGPEATRLLQHYFKLVTSYYKDPLPQGKVLMEQFEAVMLTTFGNLKQLSSRTLAAQDMGLIEKQEGANRNLTVDGVRINDLTMLDVWHVDEDGDVWMMDMDDIPRSPRETKRPRDEHTTLSKAVSDILAAKN